MMKVSQARKRKGQKHHKHEANHEL